MTQRLGQAIALVRRSVRMRRIDGSGISVEVLEDAFNNRRRFDAGDDSQSASALPAGLDIDGKDSPEALRPAHRFKDHVLCAVMIRRRQSSPRDASSPMPT